VRYLAILILFAASAHAQVVEVAGGSSTLLESSGAAATFHFQNSTEMLSVGDSNGKLGLGFADTRDFHGWTLTTGDKPFSATAGNAGTGIGVRGLSLTRHVDGRECRGPEPAMREPIFGVGSPCWVHGFTVTFFVGASGPSYASPYYQATTAQHFGAGIFAEYEVSHGLKADTLAVLAGPKKTAVGALAYRWRILKAQGAAGILEDARYWNAALDLQPARWADINTARTSYYFATVNSAGASVQAGPFNVHGAMFDSQTTRGQSYGASARFWLFDLRSDRFQSRAGTSTTSMIGERILRRLEIQEFVSNHNSFAAGGTFTSNLFVLSVSQQTYFMPLIPARPFQRSLSVQLSFRVPHDTAVTLATNVDPTGKLRYGAYASTFAYGNLATEPRRARRKGYLISGQVVDKSGMPVSGAAISVDRELVYTDATGTFSARVRHTVAPIAVSLDDFAAPGEWLVVSAPASASPDSPVTITITRK
jgi:hypothetical protein